MTSELTKIFLGKCFRGGECRLEFNELNAKKLLNFLKENLSVDELIKQRDLIDSSIKEFFEETFLVVTYFDGIDDLKIKFLPIEFSKQELLVIKNLSNNIHKYIKEVKESEKNGVFIINEKILKNIVLDVDFGGFDQKTILRKAIRDCFMFSVKDLIMFTSGKVVIKLFNSTENRSNGIPEDLLILMEDNIAKEVGIANFFRSILDDLLEDKLNFEKIEHQIFEKNYLSIFMAALIGKLQSHLNDELPVIEGIAGYLVRKNFKYVHILMAENLLKKISKNSYEAYVFLRYFSGDRGVLDGKEVVFPKIIDFENNHIRVVDIKNLVVERRRVKKEFYEIKNLVSSIKESIIEYEEHLRDIDTKMREISSISNYLNDELYSNEKYYEEEKCKLKLLIENLQKYSKEHHDNFLTNEIDLFAKTFKDIGSSEAKMQIEVDTVDKDLRNLEKLYHTMERKIDSLKDEEIQKLELFSNLSTKQKIIDKKYLIFLNAVAQSLSLKIKYI